MSSEEPAARTRPPRPEFTLTDPKAMRALAHPVRMSLLDLFSVSPVLTATQAGEALGETPANCAFHLRTLAKYGLVEEAGGGRGRERPWQRVHGSISVSSGRQDNPQSRMAADVLGAAFRDRWLDGIRRAFAVQAWDDAWDPAVIASNTIRFLTPAETVEITAKMMEIIDSYRDRTDDPALRPGGALPVDISVFTYPLTDTPPIAPDDGDDEALYRMPEE